MIVDPDALSNPDSGGRRAHWAALPTASLELELAKIHLVVEGPKGISSALLKTELATRHCLKFLTWNFCSIKFTSLSGITFKSQF